MRVSATPRLSFRGPCCPRTFLASGARGRAALACGSVSARTVIVLGRVLFPGVGRDPRGAPWRSRALHRAGLCQVCDVVRQRREAPGGAVLPGALVSRADCLVKLLVAPPDRRGVLEQVREDQQRV